MAERPLFPDCVYDVGMMRETIAGWTPSPGFRRIIAMKGPAQSLGPTRLGDQPCYV